MPETLRAKTLKAFQLLRRLEEADDNGFCECVTCGVVKHYTEVHGGHWLPKGKSSYFSLDKRNVWPQCPGCNLFGMKRFGKSEVDQMLADSNKPIKLYARDYRDMLAEFNAEITKQKSRLL
jgi:hypothetical protein